MTKLEKVLYTAKAHTTGGPGGGGASRTDDGQSAIFLFEREVAQKPVDAAEQLRGLRW